MKKFPGLFFCILLVSGSHSYAVDASSFPGLTSVTALAGADEFVNIYGSYAQALSNHYGKAVIFSNHLSYPVGEDHLGAFPRTYIGIGMGAAFANTNAIKSDSSSEVTGDALPAVLPAAGLSLNLGIGLSNNWDFRLTALPPISFSLPQGDLTTTIKLMNFKGKLTYNLKESKSFDTGFSIAGYVAYSKGSVGISAENLKSENRDFSSNSGSGTVQDFSYNVNTTAAWNYFSMGTEVRGWVDLYIIVPYIGYGLGFQGGLFSTDVGLDGTIQVNVNVVTETSPADVNVGRTAKPSILSHRFFLGFEIKIKPTPVRLGVEAQFELENKLAGISLGAAMQF